MPLFPPPLSLLSVLPGSLGPFLGYRWVPELTLWTEGAEGLRVETLEDWLGWGTWKASLLGCQWGPSAPWPGLDSFPLWPGASSGGPWGLGRDASQQTLDLALLWAI